MNTPPANTSRAPRAERQILRCLADEHVPCLRCGYDLFGSTTLECAECGEPITLNTIYLSGIVHGSLTGSFGLAGIMIGVPLALIIVLIALVAPRSGSLEGQIFLLFALAGAAIEIGLAVYWSDRHRIARLPQCGLFPALSRRVVAGLGTRGHNVAPSRNGKLVTTMPAPDPPSTTELLRRLAEHDTPCPRCLYNLRGLTSPVCPECGEIATLAAIHAARARRRPPVWWFGAVGASTGAPLTLASCLFLPAATWGIGADAPVAWTVMCLFLLSIAAEWTLLLVWLDNARWVASLRPWTRWTIAAFTWWPHAALIVAFVRHL